MRKWSTQSEQRAQNPSLCGSKQNQLPRKQPQNWKWKLPPTLATKLSSLGRNCLISCSATRSASCTFMSYNGWWITWPRALKIALQFLSRNFHFCYGQLNFSWTTNIPMLQTTNSRVARKRYLQLKRNCCVQSIHLNSGKLHLTLELLPIPTEIHVLLWASLKWDILADIPIKINASRSFTSLGYGNRHFLLIRKFPRF